MYYHPSTWYYPSSQSMSPMRQDMMMPEDMKEMMNMMRQHVMMTNEIKRTVDIINERCRRMEEKMKEMERKMM
ncbi:hypothetical protein [Brevibacillus centrosporus]|uniref:hypothetical protein n=1 Tax=Brevibacillus centrosporus TaxID=54910 RepID=UPI003B012ABF